MQKTNNIIVISLEYSYVRVQIDNDKDLKLFEKPCRSYRFDLSDTEDHEDDGVEIAPLAEKIQSS